MCTTASSAVSVPKATVKLMPPSTQGLPLTRALMFQRPAMGVTNSSAYVPSAWSTTCTARANAPPGPSSVSWMASSPSRRRLPYRSAAFSVKRHVSPVCRFLSPSMEILHRGAYVGPATTCTARQQTASESTMTRSSNVPARTMRAK